MEIVIEKANDGFVAMIKGDKRKPRLVGSGKSVFKAVESLLKQVNSCFG